MTIRTIQAAAQELPAPFEYSGAGQSSAEWTMPTSHEGNVVNQFEFEDYGGLRRITQGAGNGPVATFYTQNPANANIPLEHAAGDTASFNCPGDEEPREVRLDMWRAQMLGPENPLQNPPLNYGEAPESPLWHRFHNRYEAYRVHDPQLGMFHYWGECVVMLAREIPKPLETVVTPGLPGGTVPGGGGAVVGGDDGPFLGTGFRQIVVSLRRWTWSIQGTGGRMFDAVVHDPPGLVQQPLPAFDDLDPFRSQGTVTLSNEPVPGGTSTAQVTAVLLWDPVVTRTRRPGEGPQISQGQINGRRILFDTYYQYACGGGELHRTHRVQWQTWDSVLARPVSMQSRGNALLGPPPLIEALPGVSITSLTNSGTNILPAPLPPVLARFEYEDPPPTIFLPQE